MEKVFAAIDLKSFYASVECVERDLDPLTTHLVVADASRTEKTICLAISPSLKAYGLPGRARLFEVNQKVREINYGRQQQAPQHIFSGKSFLAPELAKHPEYQLDFIIAKPRMHKYLEYSQRIYQTYLQFVAPEDIFAYSVDEIFCDLTSYLKMYHTTPAELVTKMITAVYQATGVTATAGIGTNMYLCKIAMDILAKHAEPDAAGVRLAELTEQTYREKLWTHQPLTDFWRVGPGYAKRLQQNFMYTMGDVARCSLTSPDLLYKLFGINAELLIDHAWGYENVEIADAKKYQPQSKSLSSGQVLHRPYSYREARVIADEMAESLTLNMARKNYLTDQLVLHVSYDVSSMQKVNLHPDVTITKDRHGRNKPKSAHGTWRLDHPTDSLHAILNGFLELFDQYVCPDFTVRRLNLAVGNLINKADYHPTPTLLQTDLFQQHQDIEQQLSQEKSDQNLQAAIMAIRQKYGKNAILRGTNFEKGATGILRNHQIGGHQA